MVTTDDQSETSNSTIHQKDDGPRQERKADDWSPGTTKMKRCGIGCNWSILKQLEKGGSHDIRRLFMYRWILQFVVSCNEATPYTSKYSTFYPRCALLYVSFSVSISNLILSPLFRLFLSSFWWCHTYLYWMSRENSHLRSKLAIIFFKRRA